MNGSRKFLSACLISSGILAWSGAFAIQEAAKVTLIYVSGDVQVRDTVDQPWKKAERSMTLGPGAEVKTGEESLCELGFLEKQESATRLQADTVAVVESVEPVKINLKGGRLYGLVQRLDKDSSFEVASPTAVASVRGTGWLQSLDSLEVYEGTVHVQTADGAAADVPGGNSISFAEGKLGELTALVKDASGVWGPVKGEVISHLSGPREAEDDPLIEKLDHTDIDSLGEAKEDSRDSGSSRPSGSGGSSGGGPGPTGPGGNGGGGTN